MSSRPLSSPARSRSSSSTTAAPTTPPARAAAAHTPAMPVRVVRCDTPGKGAAVREGMRHTTADVVGFMDADGATHLEALEQRPRAIIAPAPTSPSARGPCAARSRPSATARSGSSVPALYRTLHPTGRPRHRRHPVRLQALPRRPGPRGLRATCAPPASPSTSRSSAAPSGAAPRSSSSRSPGTTSPARRSCPMRHGASAFWELALIARRLRGQPHTAGSPCRLAGRVRAGPGARRRGVTERRSLARPREWSSSTGATRGTSSPAAASATRGSSRVALRDAGARRRVLDGPRRRGSRRRETRDGIRRAPPRRPVRVLRGRVGSAPRRRACAGAAATSSSTWTAGSRRSPRWCSGRRTAGRARRPPRPPGAVPHRDAPADLRPRAGSWRGG